MTRLEVGRLEEAAAVYAAARRELGWQREALQSEVRAALEWGMSESEVARRAGVTRMTVRAWRKGQALP